jgi:tripartite ATP-independent transporter DctM subunit
MAVSIATIEEVISAGTARAAGPPGLRRTWTRAVDGAIGAVVEPLAATIIVVEVVILASGVFSRYVLRNPLVWTDELGTILFLWLTMMGAVVAYRRGGHMRLTAVANAVSPGVRKVFEAISSTVVAIFCLELLPPSGTFLGIEQNDLTPALSLPRSYVIAAIVAGLALILVLAILRLIDGESRIVLPVIAGAVLVSALAWFGRGALAPLGNFNLVIFFFLVVGACITIGVPIAFSFGFGTLSYLALRTQVPLSTVVGRMDEGVSNLVLLAVPLFILLGVLLENAGIAKRLVDFLASLVGHFRGGLSIVLLGAMYLVSGISGAKVADMAAVAPVLFPEMERRGQTRGEMVALLSGSAAMAETIPPSLVLIIIGSVTGVSITALFTAGLLPALVAAVALMVVALIRSRNDRVELAAHPSPARIWRLFLIAIPGLVLPLLIRFFVIEGIATATEVSVVGILYTVAIGALVYRELKWGKMYPLLRETAALSGAILIIIATATAMGWALTQSGFAQQLTNAIGHVPGGRAGFLGLSIVLFIVLGSVLEGIPAVVLFGPLLFPIAVTYGVEEVQYAIVAVLAMGIGLFAPPLGVGYYGACVIGKIDPDAAITRVIPYLAAVVGALILVAAIPWLSLGFIPKT